MKISAVLDPQSAPTEDADERLEAMAANVLRLKLAADAAKDAFDEADKEFRAALAKAGRLNPDFQGIGHVHTAISPTKRYNEDLARGVVTKYLKKADIKACEKTVLDSAIVKAKLTPAQYEECQKTSGWTVKYSLSKQ